MRIRLDQILVHDFKRIGDLTLDLKSITALVGGNTSGKSSALQAAQLGASILQASVTRTRADGTPVFGATVANDAVLFRPTEHLLNLRRGERATQKDGYSISYFGVDLDDDEAVKHVIATIRLGKNSNINLAIDGDLDFAAVLADREQPFSILTPGLSGIPMREEWRTKGAMDAAVMHGDANLYLRTVLDHLFNSGMGEADKAAWLNNQDLLALPDVPWRTFSSLLDRCYPDARISVWHDQLRERYVPVEVQIGSTAVTLDMASTGMLQVIQILAYACYYSPPLLLLDEPDAHLHADSQSRLYDALRGIATETTTRIVFATHSPQLIQRLMYDPEATLVWMSNGAQVPVDEARRPAIPILMTVGALTSGADIFDPARSTIVLTEDKLTRPVTVLAKANGAPDNVAVLSYNGCGNLGAARLLAGMITGMRDDARIIIHRDRDFRTDNEMAFELAVAASDRVRQGVERVEELFTPLNDVEHSFAQASHLRTAFAAQLAPEIVDGIIVDVTAQRRDDLVNAARVARDQIKRTLYDVERKLAKPEWAQTGMPDQEPNPASFRPADGHQPVDFAHSHGKKLMDGLRPALHHHLHGPSQAIADLVYTVSDALKDATWGAQFGPAQP